MARQEFYFILIFFFFFFLLPLIEKEGLSLCITRSSTTLLSIMKSFSRSFTAPHYGTPKRKHVVQPIGDNY
jgi:hypothetical protein